jgi:hypothetical protein
MSRNHPSHAAFKDAWTVVNVRFAAAIDFAMAELTNAALQCQSFFKYAVDTILSGLAAFSASACIQSLDDALLLVTLSLAGGIPVSQASFDVADVQNRWVGF